MVVNGENQSIVAITKETSLFQVDSIRFLKVKIDAKGYFLAPTFDVNKRMWTLLSKICLLDLSSFPSAFKKAYLVLI